MKGRFDIPCRGLAVAFSIEEKDQNRKDSTAPSTRWANTTTPSVPSVAKRRFEAVLVHRYGRADSFLHGVGMTSTLIEGISTRG